MMKKNHDTLETMWLCYSDLIRYFDVEFQDDMQLYKLIDSLHYNTCLTPEQVLDACGTKYHDSFVQFLKIKSFLAQELIRNTALYKESKYTI